jgi:glutamine synthetase
MSKWTDQLPEAARDYIGNRRVDEVECIIGDIAGVARGKAMPARKFGQADQLLPAELDLSADDHRGMG